MAEVEVVAHDRVAGVQAVDDQPADELGGRDLGEVEIERQDQEQIDAQRF